MNIVPLDALIPLPAENAPKRYPVLCDSHPLVSKMMRGFHSWVEESTPKVSIHDCIRYFLCVLTADLTCSVTHVCADGRILAQARSFST